MTTITVSAMSPLPASSATYTYGITNSSTEGKVAVGISDGLAIFSGNTLVPASDGAGTLGAAGVSWTGVVLDLAGTVSFNDINFFSFTDTVGPKFNNLTLDISALSHSHTLTFANIGGTVTIQTDVQKEIPIAGDTVSVNASSGISNVFINPAGTLATLTLAFPAGTFPNQVVYVTFTKIITTLTVSAANIGSSGFASPVAATATSTFAWAWDVGAAAWQRFL